MDAIKKAIAQLTIEIVAREDAIKVLSRLLPAATGTNTKEAKPGSAGKQTWTDEQRRAAARRAKAQWRKRKALRAQNRAKVTKVAAKKKG